jgi:hypothetical protein
MSSELTESVLSMAEAAGKSGKLRRKELHVVTALCNKLGIEVKGHKAALCRKIYSHYGLDINLTDVASKTVAPGSAAASPAVKDISAEDVMEAYENKKSKKELLHTQILADRYACIRAARKFAEELEHIDRQARVDVNIIELHATAIQTMSKRLREFHEVEKDLEGYRKLVRQSGSSSGTDRGCPICYESFDDVENVEMVYPTCGHVCCGECTQKMKTVCPLCNLDRGNAFRLFRN